MRKAHAQIARWHSHTPSIISLFDVQQKSFFILHDMADDDAGGSGTAPTTPAMGDLKSIIKESLRELLHKDPTLLESGGCRRDSERPAEEDNLSLCMCSL